MYEGDITSPILAKFKVLIAIAAHLRNDRPNTETFFLQMVIEVRTPMFPQMNALADDVMQVSQIAAGPFSSGVPVLRQSWVALLNVIHVCLVNYQCNIVVEKHEK